MRQFRLMYMYVKYMYFVIVQVVSEAQKVDQKKYRNYGTIKKQVCLQYVHTVDIQACTYTCITGVHDCSCTIIHCIIYEHKYN